MPSDRTTKYRNLIQKCWIDPDFKNQLMNDPAQTMRNEGIEIPEHVSVTAVENTKDQFTLVIPPKPNGKIEIHLDHLIKDIEELSPHFQELP